MVYLALILAIANMGVTVYFIYYREKVGKSEEEQKISRGLQIVQSKIAVLEDLSDQVDMQVKQISTLLEGKYRELQTHLADADMRMNEIQSHVQRGHEVSKLFKDKIPHEEMIQRKNMVKYVKAAKMAHAGATSQEISVEVDLPISEIEMITKVNRNGLMFSEQALPEWIKDELTNVEQDLADQMEVAPAADMASLLSRDNPLIPTAAKKDVAPEEKKAFKQLSEQFKRATQQVNVQATVPTQMMSAPASAATAASGPTVKPYEFRKITGNN